MVVNYPFLNNTLANLIFWAIVVSLGMTVLVSIIVSLIKTILKHKDKEDSKVVNASDYPEAFSKDELKRGSHFNVINSGEEITPPKVVLNVDEEILLKEETYFRMYYKVDRINIHGEAIGMIVVHFLAPAKRRLALPLIAGDRIYISYTVKPGGTTTVVDIGELELPTRLKDTRWTWKGVIERND
jgi:hypothetical protein